jgi:hypothetical protein
MPSVCVVRKTKRIRPPVTPVTCALSYVGGSSSVSIETRPWGRVFRKPQFDSL